MSGSSTITVDIDTPDGAIALAVVDESMEPYRDGTGGFSIGDLVVVSPGTSSIKGDVVVARRDGGDAMLRVFMPRGTDRSGNQAFDLIPTNPEYQTVTINSTCPGWIVGTVIEHRRRFRS